MISRHSDRGQDLARSIAHPRKPLEGVERLDAFFERAEVAAREIGPSHAAPKEGIPRKEGVVHEQTDAALRMPGRCNDPEGEAVQRRVDGPPGSTNTTKLRMTKSTKKMNFLALTSTSSIMPFGSFTVLFASYKRIFVDFASPSPNFL